ncbi:hypothetical protein DL769_009633 [Monosporascus sp. CRB-8-3]|nr:hypothetical protein DL769_009633 [Monosporascus sp. CRB-8-3]
MSLVLNLLNRQDSGRPGLEPPEGVTPQFDNPPNRKTEAYVGMIICIVVTAFCVFTRGSFLIITRKKPKIEDYLSVASVIVHVASLLYEASMVTIKVAILLEWLRIFSPTRDRDAFFWTTWALLILIMMYYTGAILALVLSCIPHARIWDKSIPGTCSDTSILFSTSSSINLVSDVLMLVLPQKKIWSLNLTIQKKLNISLAFSIGLMACASAAVRLNAGVQAYRSPDQTYSIAPIALWCMAEMTCGFLIFSLPGAPKVFGADGCGGRFATKAGIRSSESMSKRAWRSNIASFASRNRYHEVDDQGMNLQPIRSGGVGLSESSPAKATPTEGILRTTRIEAREEPAKSCPTPGHDARW